MVRDGDLLEFRITADAFLRHMVRVLVGTMLDRPDPDALPAACWRDGRAARPGAPRRPAG